MCCVHRLTLTCRRGGTHEQSTEATEHTDSHITPHTCQTCPEPTTQNMSCSRPMTTLTTFSRCVKTGQGGTSPEMRVMPYRRDSTPSLLKRCRRELFFRLDETDLQSGFRRSHLHNSIRKSCHGLRHKLSPPPPATRLSSFAKSARKGWISDTTPPPAFATATLASPRHS